MELPPATGPMAATALRAAARTEGAPPAVELCAMGLAMSPGAAATRWLFARGMPVFLIVLGTTRMGIG